MFTYQCASQVALKVMSDYWKAAHHWKVVLKSAGKVYGDQYVIDIAIGMTLMPELFADNLAFPWQVS